MSKEQLFDELKPMAERLAGWYYKRQYSIDKDDLVQVALMGLWEHLIRHEGGEADDIKRMAPARVRGALFDHARKMDALTTRQRTAVRAYFRGSELTRRRQRTAESVAGMQLIQWQHTINKRGLDTPVIEPIHQGPTPEECAAHAQRVRQVKRAVSELPPRTQQILGSYYRRDTKLHGIAQAFGLSRGRICQIQSEAVATLRGVLALTILAIVSTGCSAPDCTEGVMVSGITFCSPGAQDLTDVPLIVETLQDELGGGLAKSFENNGLVVHITEDAIVTKCTRVYRSTGYTCQLDRGFFVVQAWAIYINPAPCIADTALAAELAHAALEVLGTPDDNHKRAEIWVGLVDKATDTAATACMDRMREANG